MSCIFICCADVLQTVGARLVHNLLLLSGVWTECCGKQPRNAAHPCTTAVFDALLLFANYTAC